MNRWAGITLVVVALGALALRVPELDRRPMHNDESVNALKFLELWQQGNYRYDPNEYHGPVLYYATLPVVWLSGAKDAAQLTETTLRLTPVLFGTGLVLLLWLMSDGLGRAGTLCAGVLTAVSPAMVFYSRYYVHEMLLVFFTLLLIAAGWRYSRTGRAGWALLGGVAAGLMYATKETFLIALAAMVPAVALTTLWNRRSSPTSLAPLPTPRTSPGGEQAPDRSVPISPAALSWSRSTSWHWQHLALAVLLAGLVSGLFFTSFLQHPAGALDALRTFLPWLRRAGGASPHIHPWYFYLERFVWFHHGRGLAWTEGAILLLAIVGFAAALKRGPAVGGHPSLLRFLGFYSLFLTAAYSLIPYKTPWCMLSAWQGLIILAGAGAATVLRWQTKRWLQALLSGLLVFAVAHLLWLARQASYVHPADRQNPYTYAQTSPDILELVGKVRALARVDPRGNAMLIKVMAPGGDYWPLPWYFRQFTQTGWWDAVPPDPLAPVIIVGARLEPGLEPRIESSHIMTGIYSLRPGVFLELYVEDSLWKRFIAGKEPTRHD